MSTPDYVARNQAAWSGWAPEYQHRGRLRWQEEPSWGEWNLPEEDLRLLPDVTGLDTLELGCGTGYVSSWLQRREANPVGLDPTREQLRSARTFQREFGVGFPLVCAAAETLPFRDKTFDLVISEYGACIWSDPYLWIPEASRVLRDGGQLIFLVNGTLLMLCVPDEDGVPADPQLRRSYFDMHRFEWPDDDSVEFHLGYGDWIRLLRRNGFEIEDLIELRPPEDASDSFVYATLNWARRWPTEEVWKARRVHRA